MAIEIMCNRGGVIHKVRSKRELPNAVKHILTYAEEKPEWFPLWIENYDKTDLMILADIERPTEETEKEKEA